MLQLRPNCEICDVDLGPQCHDAMICTFECTFCRRCAAVRDNVCPNCGGNLLQRPARPAELLEKYPASTERVLKTPAPSGES